MIFSYTRKPYSVPETARCRCKIWYASKFTTASHSLPYDSMALVVVAVVVVVIVVVCVVVRVVGGAQVAAGAAVFVKLFRNFFCKQLCDTFHMLIILASFLKFTR